MLILVNVEPKKRTKKTKKNVRRFHFRLDKKKNSKLNGKTNGFKRRLNTSQCTWWSKCNYHISDFFFSYSVAVTSVVLIVVVVPFRSLVSPEINGNFSIQTWPMQMILFTFLKAHTTWTINVLFYFFFFIYCVPEIETDE